MAGAEKFFRRRPGFLGRHRDVARRNRYPGLGEELFGLVFVDVHSEKVSFFELETSNFEPETRNQKPKRLTYRCSIGTTFNPTGPTYWLWGRISRLSASCSRTWAVQPAARAMAKIGVNKSVGMPRE